MTLKNIRLGHKDIDLLAIFQNYFQKDSNYLFVHLSIFISINNN